MLAAEAGDPDIERGEFFLERNDLSERTAQVGLSFPKLGTEFGSLLGDGLLGMQGFNRDAQTGFDLGFQFERFGEEKAGVDGENREAESVGVGGVHGDEARALKARAERRALAESLPGPSEDFAQARAFEFLGLAPNHLAVVQRGHAKKETLRKLRRGLLVRIAAAFAT